MSWNGVKQQVEFRRELLSLAKPGVNVRQLCKQFRISRKTFYKWLKRYNKEGSDGLKNQSRRPHRSPTKTKASIEARVLSVRAEKRSWGARKLRKVLMERGMTGLPADSTIHQILKRHEQIDAKESAKHHKWQRFEHEAPNQLWQMDFKGWFRTDDHRQCHPLTVLDDHSRYVVCLEACSNQQTDTVQSRLTTTFRQYGVPERMTMDNGAPWGSDQAHPFTPLTVWFIRLGIRVSHSRPYHPQTQGKDERFHRTLGVDLLQWHHFRNIADVQHHFEQYRNVYNHERPHQALGLNVPASRYAISPRSFPEVLAPIEYGASDVVRIVCDHGRIRFGGKRFAIGKAFRGYPVALRPTTEDGILNVFFCHQKITSINQRA